MTGFKLAVLGGDVWDLRGFKRNVKIFWQVCSLCSKCVYLLHPVNVYFLSAFMGMFLECFPVLSVWYVSGLSVTIVLDFMHIFVSSEIQVIFYAKQSLWLKNHIWKEKKCQEACKDNDITGFQQPAADQILEYNSELARVVEISMKWSPMPAERRTRTLWLLAYFLLLTLTTRMGISTNTACFNGRWPLLSRRKVTGCCKVSWAYRELSCVSAHAYSLQSYKSTSVQAYQSCKSSACTALICKEHGIQKCCCNLNYGDT